MHQAKEPRVWLSCASVLVLYALYVRFGVPVDVILVDDLSQRRMRAWKIKANAIELKQKADLVMCFGVANTASLHRTKTSCQQSCLSDRSLFPCLKQAWLAAESQATAATQCRLVGCLLAGKCFCADTCAAIEERGSRGGNRGTRAVWGGGKEGVKT